MGLALLQDAFDLVKATPISVSGSPEPDVSQLIFELSKVVSISEDRVNKWNLNIEKLINEIPTASQIYISESGDVNEIVVDIEKLRFEIEDRLAKIVHLQERSELVSGEAHREARLYFGEKANRYIEYSEAMRKLIEKDRIITSKFSNFLTTFLADIDPEARGGPSFDDADDLIAYLHRQVEA